MSNFIKRIWRFWWTHGPGSVGSVAKAMSKTYTKFKKEFPNESKHNLTLMTLSSRYPFENQTTNIMGQILPAPAHELVSIYNDNLYNIIMVVLFIEHPELIEIPIDIMQEIMDIVENIIKKYAPDAI